ncbi:MAG: HAD-IC family P-type ATPase [Candidatus Nomurabacteria bacterium]|nr:HAD-IC family P-type ATPase [Candidatus Nomurabacteria bacterium]
MRKFELYRRVLPSITPILFRNIVILVNGIIFGVVILLSIFGNKQAALFIGIVFIVNILLGVIQDIRARVMLERLQMLTALKAIRLNKDGSEKEIFAEEIILGDEIKLKLGDQVPCDGLLFSANNLEVSEALLTGESDSFPKKEGEKLVAGSIITSGVGIIRVDNIFKESRISRITDDAKKYALNPSSIQRSMDTVIKYSGYILILSLIFVVIRGFIAHESYIDIVMHIGALASIIVPQGLMVITTLLFTIGASSYSRHNVLFQEINATEKLGRIKNLCMDKTGTLTDNILVVENVFMPEGISKELVFDLTSIYINGSGDSSQTILAIEKYIGSEVTKRNESINALPFSSWRQYGAVSIGEKLGHGAVFVGTASVFLPQISNSVEKKWLEDILQKNAHTGKRILCVVRSEVNELPRELSKTNLSVVAVFIFTNTLRLGVKEAIKFFQDRDIKIRIISGDNPDTVRAVTTSVGIKNSENVISGNEISKWKDEDFEKKVHDYTVFAQILPEQKLKLIEAFKKDGFTAMVGDGVNDALAIKRADLGIAMFDGAPVTRQVAGVILTNSTFTDLPGAVELSDNFIRSIGMNAGIFINQSLIGLFFFIIISLFGYAFTLTPLNITAINYFTVGIPGMLIGYWAIQPSRKNFPSNGKSFLRQIMPFVLCSAIFESIAIALVFFFSPEYLKMAQSNTLVILGFIVSGFIFLALAPNVYSASLTKKEKFHLFILAIVEIILMMLILRSSILVHFFNITTPYPPINFVAQSLLILLAFGIVQYFIMKKFFIKR